jgi:hypothetical protein
LKCATSPWPEPQIGLCPLSSVLVKRFARSRRGRGGLLPAIRLVLLSWGAGVLLWGEGYGGHHAVRWYAPQRRAVRQCCGACREGGWVKGQGSDAVLFAGQAAGLSAGWWADVGERAVSSWVLCGY